MTINLDYLLERNQATEDQIVTYLVAHFYEPIHHLALTILQDGLAADDVAQETLLKAANRIHQYEPHSNLKAWVYRIGLNEARSQLRHLPILLRYSHNLSTPEIAEIMQLSPGTVRSRLHYAHQKLHHLLSMTG